MEGRLLPRRILVAPSFSLLAPPAPALPAPPLVVVRASEDAEDCTGSRAFWSLAFFAETVFWLPWRRRGDGGRPDMEPGGLRRVMSRWATWRKLMGSLITGRPFLLLLALALALALLLPPAPVELMLDGCPEGDRLLFALLDGDCFFLPRENMDVNVRARSLCGVAYSTSSLV